MRLVVLSYIVTFCTVLAGCTDHPYVVCRGDMYCTPPMTHEEAVHAAQLKRAWADDALYVRPSGVE